MSILGSILTNLRSERAIISQVVFIKVKRPMRTCSVCAEYGVENTSFNKNIGWGE